MDLLHWGVRFTLIKVAFFSLSEWKSLWCVVEKIFFFPKPILVLKSFLIIIFQLLNGSQKQHLWYVHVMSFFVFVSFILQVHLDKFYLGYWHTCHYFMSYSAITNTLVPLSNYQITIYWYMFLFGLHVCQQYVANLHMYTNLYTCTALLYQINQKIRFWQWKTIHICVTRFRIHIGCIVMKY